MKNSTYQDFAKRILEYDDIVLFPHVFTDGDALGSSSALCMALRQLGKHAAVLLSEPPADNLDFLDYGCVVYDLSSFGKPGLSVAVDCGSVSRIPGREEAFFAAPARACLDHHGESDQDIEFDFVRIEPDSAATGELVYRVIRELGATVDLPIANALYAAITTDTGDFSYNNTTARSHRITAEFFGVPGFDPKAVTALLYERRSFSALRLEGAMLRTVRLYYGGRLGIGRVTQAMLRESGAKMTDTDSFIGIVRSIDGVEAACMIKEQPDGSIRVSLRAKRDVNVAAVARLHGGGGHVRAAGCTFRGMSPDEVEEALTADFGFLND